MRITAGANAWRNFEGVMGDRRLSRKCKGNVFGSCVAPEYMNAQETMAVIEKQQKKAQICEKQPGKHKRGS